MRLVTKRALPYSDRGVNRGAVEILLTVAVIAEFRGLFLEKLGHIGLVGFVARRAHASLRWRMDILSVKRGRVVTVQAHTIAKEEFLGLARMGAVAGRAHPSHHGHVHYLLSGELALVVAHETQVRRLRRKALRPAGELVWDFGGIDTGVADAAPHVHRRMHRPALCEVGVAHIAIGSLGASLGSQTENGCGGRNYENYETKSFSHFVFVLAQAQNYIKYNSI